MNKKRLQYETDGFFLQTDPIVPRLVIDRASEGMDALRRGDYDTDTPPQSSYWNPGDPDDKLIKIEQPQFANRAIMELITFPTIGELIAELTGAEIVQVWWVQLLGKPPMKDPNSALRIGWHQDRNYWQIWEEGSEILTAWIAISDVTPETGPMKFVRGSHKWGMIEGSSFYGQDLDGLQKSLSGGRDWDQIAAILPPGGISVHHCLTLHGSDLNFSDQMRRSFAIHLRTEKSRPVDDQRTGLTKFIDNHDLCPIIYSR